MNLSHDKAQALLTELGPQWPCQGLRITIGPVSKEVKGESIRPFYCRHRDAADGMFDATADRSSTASKDDGAAATYPLAHEIMHLSRSGTAHSVADLSYSSDADSEPESAFHSIAQLISRSTAELAAHSLTSHDDSSDDESHVASSARDGSSAAVLAAHSLADLLNDSNDIEDEAVSSGQPSDGGGAELYDAHSMACLNGSSGPYLAAHSIKFLSSAEVSPAAIAADLSDTSDLKSCPNPVHLHGGSAADFPPGSAAALSGRRHMPGACLGMPAAAAAHAGTCSRPAVTAPADRGPSTSLAAKQGSLQPGAGGLGQARRIKSALRIRRRLHRLEKGFCAPFEALPAPLQR